MQFVVEKIEAIRVIYRHIKNEFKLALFNLCISMWNSSRKSWPFQYAQKHLVIFSQTQLLLKYGINCSLSQCEQNAIIRIRKMSRSPRMPNYWIRYGQFDIWIKKFKNLKLPRIETITQTLICCCFYEKSHDSSNKWFREILQKHAIIVIDLLEFDPRPTVYLYLAESSGKQ